MRNDDGMMTLDGPGVHRRTPDIPYGFLEPLRSNYEARVTRRWVRGIPAYEITHTLGGRSLDRPGQASGTVLTRKGNLLFSLFHIDTMLRNTKG